MTRLALATFISLALLACPNGPNPDGGTGGGRGGGAGGGSGLTPFGVSELDADARETRYFAIAVDPVTERVGVAYYTPAGTQMYPDTPDLDLKYVEWKQGVVSTPEKIATVQRFVGVSIAFDPTSGEPLVAYVGGTPQLNTSIYWFQSDAVISRRNAGTWTETTVAETGDLVTCNNLVSDRGDVVGLWPSLLFDPAK
ncbi:MAG: hypothetical protein ACO1OB_28195 [Archangium sp.]